MNTTQLALQTGFIDRIVEKEIIPQRITDGYVNATAMCKAAGKRWGDYAALSTTKPFIYELASVNGVAVNGLIQSIQGGVPQHQGTWVHPQIAIHLAQWLSPKFAVLVSQWVFEWMRGDVKGANLPYHLRRYMANAYRVPYGYFSMLNEVTLALIGPLEQMGFTLPSNMLPDGSLGKVFSKYLRDAGYPVDTYPTYPHCYEDGREFDVRAYPNELLGELRRFFVEVWLKDRSVEYFAKRAPDALPYLQKFLTLPNYREVMGYVATETETALI